MPWFLHLRPDRPKRFMLNLRIPGWARNQPVPGDLYRYADGLNPQVTLAVNGRPAAIRVEKGFARIERTWKKGDSVVLNLEMPVRK